MRSFFEFFGIFYFEDFSDVCHESGIYFYLLFFIIFSSLILNFIYYFIIDSSIYNRFSYYSGIIIINIFVVLFISYFLIRINIQKEGFIFMNLPYFTLSLISGFYGGFVFFVGSIFFKLFSKNSYRIPF